MAKLIWDEINNRRYESGVSQGVFYPQSGPGVVWNGLRSVTKSAAGGDVAESYLDGIKYLSVAEGRNFEATLKAFSAPDEFAAYGGDKPYVSGILLGNQPKPRFHLSYRTGVNESDYQIHLVYNVLATMSGRNNQTGTDQSKLLELQWKLAATPVPVPLFRPTAYFVIDSQKATPAKLTALENILYGTSTLTPAFPPINILLTLFGA